MRSLRGTMWRLIEAHTFDGAGNKLLPLGPQPIGFVIFEAERMLAAVADGRALLPPTGTPPRFFIAYTGTYTFDGVELITRADTASAPELLADQIRRIRFESTTRMVVEAISGVTGQRGTEVVWERVT